MRLLSNPQYSSDAFPNQRVAVRLILLEAGSNGFEPPKPSSDAPFDVVVVVQSAGETCAEFTQRALRRLQVIERSDRVLAEAVIAAGDCSGPAPLRAREQLARAVLRQLRRNGQGEIVLAAVSDAAPELRHQLLELAGSLTVAGAGSDVCVRVLFDSPQPVGFDTDFDTDLETEAEQAEAELKSGIHTMPDAESYSAARTLLGRGLTGT